MSNAKHIRINGLLPFNCIDPEPEGGYDTDKECLRDWFARMNTATFGVRIGWNGPVESRPNKTGGKTAFYAFTIDGFEAVTDSALEHCCGPSSAATGRFTTRKSTSRERSKPERTNPRGIEGSVPRLFQSG